MARHALGRSGIAVGPLAFGGNVFGWTADEATSFALLDAFVAAGLNLIDTADVYSRWVPGHSGGESETIIGDWLKARGGRDKVVIATKAGIEMGPDEKGLSKAYILRAVERSLKRLQTDYIDLYQSHVDDPSVPLEETLGAYQELIQAGKVRAIGASNYTAERLTEALEVSKVHGLPRYETLQPLYNLAERADFETGLAELCRREEIGVIPYSRWRAASSPASTGRGGYGRPRPRRAGEDPAERARLPHLAALDKVAAEDGRHAAQISLAWLVAHGIAAPIASATSLPQLEELIGATRLELSAEAVAALDAASA